MYAFWNGMSPETQLHILWLCARTPSVRRIAVFRHSNWSRYEHGNIVLFVVDVFNLTAFGIAVIESLHENSDDTWTLQSTVQTRMYGSSASHTAWVIRRE